MTRNPVTEVKRFLQTVTVLKHNQRFCAGKQQENINFALV